MPFRGYFALSGVELSNSARAAAHLGLTPPTNDILVWGDEGDCSLIPTQEDPGLYEVPASSIEYEPGLGTPPNGSRLYDPGLYEVGDCWKSSNLCTNCRPNVLFDDSWSSLQQFLGDSVYRPEIAPWYSVDDPASAEFGGVWVLDAKGFDSVPMSRPITELVGSGAVAGPHRDTSRPLQFTALLFACSNAGLVYGLNWLDRQLRATKYLDDPVLRYLAAHPEGSGASAEDLVREIHQVVLTKAAVVTQASGSAKQATMCTVSWEMTALHPYSYRPGVTFQVIFDLVENQPIEWVHGASCDKPSTCEEMSIMFSEECTPEQIDIVTSPPPTCGGCLPVCAIQTSVLIVDIGFPFPLTSGETQPEIAQRTVTVVSWSIINNGSIPLTVQSYWRLCAADIECETQSWPAQITGLPSGVMLTFDAIRRRYWTSYADHANRQYRPVGMVSTPSGSPWEPAILDRSSCWEFVVVAPDGADFDVMMSFYDREA